MRISQKKNKEQKKGEKQTADTDVLNSGVYDCTFIDPLSFIARVLLGALYVGVRMRMYGTFKRTKTNVRTLKDQ